MLGTIVGDHYDYLFKMVVIGDSGVGKTNLLSRFEKNEFSQESKPTIGVQFATKTITMDNSKIKTQMWDTAGQQRFRAITQAYYKGATGALIVFDLTRRQTYDNVAKWIKELKENTEEGIVCILVGNKCDLQTNRAVKQEEVIEFAHEMKLFYLQTSAASGQNVESAFMTVIAGTDETILAIYENRSKIPKSRYSTNPKVRLASTTKDTTPHNDGSKSNTSSRKCCQ